jgi:hypothetical protein
MSGKRTTPAIRAEFYRLLAETSVEKAAALVGLSNATGYRLAALIRADGEEIACPTCRGKGRVVFEVGPTSKARKPGAHTCPGGREPCSACVAKEEEEGIIVLA